MKTAEHISLKSEGAFALVDVRWATVGAVALRRPNDPEFVVLAPNEKGSGERPTTLRVARLWMTGLVQQPEFTLAESNDSEYPAAGTRSAVTLTAQPRFGMEGNLEFTRGYQLEPGRLAVLTRVHNASIHPLSTSVGSSWTLPLQGGDLSKVTVDGQRFSEGAIMDLREDRPHLFPDWSGQADVVLPDGLSYRIQADPDSERTTFGLRVQTERDGSSQHLQFTPIAGVHPIDDRVTYQGLYLPPGKTTTFNSSITLLS